MEKTATVDLSDEYQRVKAYHQHVAEDIDSHRIDAIFPDGDTTIGLRRHHNQASLLCCCPREILELIFSIASEADRSQLPLFVRPNWTSCRIPMAARISHVCNRWREVCLNDPRLWTNINVDLFGKWPVTFMQRSGSAPLNIIMDIYHCGSDIVDAVVLALPRVQSLQVRGPHGHLTRFMQRLTAPAPILETATFCRSYLWLHARGWSPISRRVTLSTTLFSGYAPRLRDLSMTGCCPASVPLAAFSNINSLRASEALSIQDIMLFLSQAADLVALDIGPTASVDSLFPSLAPGTPIHLPHMTKLRVRDRVLPTVDAAMAFLSALHAPHLSQLDVSISVQHTDHGLARHVLHVLSILLAIVMKNVREWHRLAIILELSYVSAEFGDPPEHNELDLDHDSKPPPPFVVSWSEGRDDSDLECMLLWTLDILPLDEVMFLSIVQGYEPSGRRWHRWSTLDACKRVTTLRIETQYPKTVIDILGAATPASTITDESNSPGASASDASTPACIFPQLKKVILVEVPLKARGSQLLPALRQFALSRKSERSLVEIAFEDCNYSADVMLALYDVAKVTWDGK